MKISYTQYINDYEFKKKNSTEEKADDFGNA